MEYNTFYEVLITIENHIINNDEFDINKISREMSLDIYDIEHAFKQYLFTHYDNYVIKKRNAVKKCLPVIEENNFYGKYGYANNRNYIDSIRLMELIDQYIDEHLSIASAATIGKALSREESVIESFIFQQVQMSSYDYINSMKLIRAAKLLVTSNKPIQSIVHICGFKSISVFNDLFVKKYNYSPKQYRIKHANTVKDEAAIKLPNQPNKTNNILSIADDIKQYILDNLATVNIQSIAEHFEINQAELRSTFSKQFGICLSDYIVKRRIEAICNAIIETDPALLSLKELIIKCGFSNFERFDIAFEYYMNQKFSTYYQNALLEIEERKKGKVVEIIPNQTIEEKLPNNPPEEQNDYFKGELLFFDIILDYILLHIPDVHEELVCKQFNINKEYLAYLFKKYYGIDSKKYIVYARTDYASKLLLKGQSGNSIAKEVLKISDPQFIYDMRKWFNCTPTEFQALNGINNNEPAVVLCFKK